MVRQAEETRYTDTLRHRRQEERVELEGHRKMVRQAEETRYTATLRHRRQEERGEIEGHRKTW
jgi:hypothetical protein